MHLAKKYLPTAEVCGAAKKLSLALFLLAQSACANPLVLKDDTSGVQKVAEVKRDLVAIRGLTFTAEVPVLFAQGEIIQRLLEDDLLQVHGEERLKDVSLAYAKLGLFPPGFDLRETLTKLYRDQAIGVYVPRVKKVLVLEETAEGAPSGSVTRLDGSSEESVLLHELTHALQDQQFSLGDRIRPSDNNDRTLALRALAEGDAVLTEIAYRFGGMEQRSLAEISELFHEGAVELGPALSELPTAIVDKLRFQYEAGASFVQRVLKERGWQGVNLLYKHPPLSTEQVLYPEKYLDLPDAPIRVDLGDLSVLFSSEWTPIENNTLGELMVECLFKQFVSREEAKRVANGWGGDRFAAFRRHNEIAFIWVTVWDSPDDAEEFFRTYPKLLAEKNSPVQSSRVYIERRDQVVVIVEGLERAHFTENIEKIWQGMKLEKEPFRSPFALQR